MSCATPSASSSGCPLDAATLADFIKKPDFAQDHEPHLSLLPEWKKETYAWGMAKP